MVNSFNQAASVVADIDSTTKIMSQVISWVLLFSLENHGNLDENSSHFTTTVEYFVVNFKTWRCRNLDFFVIQTGKTRRKRYRKS